MAKAIDKYKGSSYTIPQLKTASVQANTAKPATTATKQTTAAKTTTTKPASTTSSSAKKMSATDIINNFTLSAASNGKIVKPSVDLPSASTKATDIFKKIHNTAVDARGSSTYAAPWNSDYASAVNKALGYEYLVLPSINKTNGTSANGTSANGYGGGGSVAGLFSGISMPQYEYISPISVDIPQYEYLGSLDIARPQYEYNDKVSEFAPSSAYTQAMEYTNSLLDKLNSGKTSYTDKISDMMAKIEGRDPFAYDPNTDPLFQSYLASAMNSGRTAMNDTIGQASALTGGYGSSYATSAANGAYNSYIQDAYDNLPEYYNAALDTYNSETSNLYNQLNMYNNADSAEYNRLYNAYNANLTQANNMYNQEYSNYWDTNNYNMNVVNSNNALRDNEFNNELNLANANASRTQYNNSLRDSEFNNSLNLANANNGITQYNNSLRDSEFNNSLSLANAKASAINSAASAAAKAKEKEKEDGYTAPKQKELEESLRRFYSGGEQGLDSYLDSLDPNIDVEAIMDYVTKYGKTYKPLGNYMVGAVGSDGSISGQMTYQDLYNELLSYGLSTTEAKAYISKNFPGYTTKK